MGSTLNLSLHGTCISSGRISIAKLHEAGGYGILEGNLELAIGPCQNYSSSRSARF